jgi:hypothetical protein
MKNKVTHNTALFLLIVTIIFFILCLLTSCNHSISGESPADIVNNYIHFINSGKHDAAYELLSKNLKQLVNKEMFKWGAAMAGQVGMIRHEVISSTFNNNMAVVKIKAFHPAGYNNILTYYLIKEDGKWRINKESRE